MASCPREAGQEVCDFAADAEAKVKAGGLAALAPGVSFPAFEPAGTPRLAAIGCPAGSVRSMVQSTPGEPDCRRTFDLAYTTAPASTSSVSTGAVIVIRFGRTAALGMLYSDYTVPAAADIPVVLVGGKTTACTEGPDNSDACRHFWPTETASEGTIAGVEVRPLLVGADAPLPEGVVLYYEIGAYASDYHEGEVRRAHIDSSGQLRVDVLWSRGAFAGRDTTVDTWVADDPFGEVVAAACLEPGTCIATGLGGGPAPGSAALRVFRSIDGGMTWRDDGHEVPVGTWFVAFTPRGVATMSWDAGTYRFWLYPSGEELQPPAEGYVLKRTPGTGATWVLNATQAAPTYDLSGQVIYRNQFPEALYREDVLARGAKGDLWIAWAQPRPGGSDPARAGSYIARMDPGGRPLEIWSAPQTHTWLQPWPLRTGLLAWGMDMGTLPPGSNRFAAFELSLFDLGSNTIRPIRELSAGLMGNRNPFIRAATVGRVLRVESPGDCLPVGLEASGASREVGCFANGVLFSDLAEERTADGISWRKVITPTGDEGWADGASLR